MSYNRNVAKAKAVHRIQETKAIQVPNIHTWSPAPPPYQPKCRFCGSKITSAAARCATCWRRL